jgi:hypothetical protein
MLDRCSSRGLNGVAIRTEGPLFRHAALALHLALHRAIRDRIHRYLLEPAPDVSC